MFAKCVASLSLVLLAPCRQETAVRDEGSGLDLKAMIGECQKQSRNRHELDLVWWIPIEWWQGTLEANGALSPEKRIEVLSVLKPYTLVIVVDGKMRLDRGSAKPLQIDYKSESEMRDGLSLKGPDGTIHRPLPSIEVDPRIQKLINSMTPIFRQILGDLGDHLSFFVFRSNGDEGQPIVRASATGKFSIFIDEKEYVWHLPLSSVVPPKICPKCSESLSGAFSFCPWDGQKLATDERK